MVLFSVSFSANLLTLASFDSRTYARPRSRSLSVWRRINTCFFLPIFHLYLQVDCVLRSRLRLKLLSSLRSCALGVVFVLRCVNYVILFVFIKYNINSYQLFNFMCLYFSHFICWCRNAHLKQFKLSIYRKIWTKTQLIVMAQIPLNYTGLFIICNYCLVPASCYF